MGVGVIRHEVKRSVVASHGLLEPAEVIEYIAKIIMRLGIIRLDGDGLGYQTNCCIVSFDLMGDDTEQMQGDGLVGIDLQYLLIHALCLRQTTCRVMSDGNVESLLEA